MTKQRLLSGMQPTGGGRLHLGNLEGALRPWVRLAGRVRDVLLYRRLARADDGRREADRHRRGRRAQTAIDYLAAGLDPDKCAIFRQSDVKEHAELHLLLSMVTPVGWLERVPTYKEKRDLVAENDTQVSYGLLGYPVLQTADIIIYRANARPGRPGPGRAPGDLAARSPAASTASSAQDIFPEPEARHQRSAPANCPAWTGAR